jgi:hypothetical protein
MRPASFAFFGLLLWLTLAVAASLRPFMIFYWQLGGIILLLLALIDGLRVWRFPIIQIQRQAR